MSNSDILSKADKVLRPVLKALSRFSWMHIEGCCAGHKLEDTLWLEINVLGMTGLNRLRDLLRILDSKLAGTDIRVDCLLSYARRRKTSQSPTAGRAPRWKYSGLLDPNGAEASPWSSKQCSLRLKNSVRRLDDSARSEAAINYCPFCSSSFVRIEGVGAADHKYRCGDCDMSWTMTDPIG